MSELPHSQAEGLAVVLNAELLPVGEDVVSKELDNGGLKLLAVKDRTGSSSATGQGVHGERDRRSCDVSRHGVHACVHDFTHRHVGCGALEFVHLNGSRRDPRTPPAAEQTRNGQKGEGRGRGV